MEIILAGYFVNMLLFILSGSLFLRAIYHTRQLKFLEERIIKLLLRQRR